MSSSERRLLRSVRKAEMMAAIELEYMLLLLRVSIEKREMLTRRVCINRRLIHQLSTRRRDDELAGNLHAHRILQRCITIESVHKENRATVAKLPRAVPISPAFIRVVQI